VPNDLDCCYRTEAGRRYAAPDVTNVTRVNQHKEPARLAVLWRFSISVCMPIFKCSSWQYTSYFQGGVDVIIVFGGSSLPNETKNLQQEAEGSRVRHLGSREWVSVGLASLDKLRGVPLK
jgi:hypothetical protein